MNFSNKVLCNRIAQAGLGVRVDLRLEEGSMLWDDSGSRENSGLVGVRHQVGGFPQRTEDIMTEIE